MIRKSAHVKTTLLIRPRGNPPETGKDPVSVNGIARLPVGSHSLRVLKDTFINQLTDEFNYELG